MAKGRIKTGFSTSFPRPRLKTQTLPDRGDLGLADQIKQRLIELVRANLPTRGEESEFPDRY